MSPKQNAYFFGGGKADGDATMKNLLGGKGANLAEMGKLGIPVPPGYTVTTEVCTYYMEKGKCPPALEAEMQKELVKMAEIMPGGVKFGDAENPLLVSVRSGARMSMPGMMETVLNVGDTDLTADDLKKLCVDLKEIIKKVLKKEFPDNAMEQLWGGILAVFASWNGKRAIAYRNIEGIPDDWGTAVNVQAMVFGNMGDTSATGVAFTRNPATGENLFFGEWLPNAQGEDVVAGLRTPMPLNKASKTPDQKDIKSLEEAMPELYKELDAIQKKLEKHYSDMQDIEFTIQEGILYMLQTRVGKRNGTAAIRMAVEMATKESKGFKITREEALRRVSADNLDELLHPMIDPVAEKKAKKIAKGLPAGPGGAHKKGKHVILVRNETSPEDVHGMKAAEAILTAKGGMTSHAALVARGWGKCCIVGCSALAIDARDKKLVVGGKTYKEGDVITLNGSKGVVYEGALPMLPSDPEHNPLYKELMKWADEVRKMKVRTNAESAEDAAAAIAMGAEGIGLARTEHMFFDPKRIGIVRQMIVSATLAERKESLAKLLPFQREDFTGIFSSMAGKPVTVRLLDPPLHEFIGDLGAKDIAALAEKMKTSPARIEARIAQLHELNPMLGHRGCRLGIAYPEITEMQARAICEAAAALTQKGIKVFPEIMVPLIGTVAEFKNQEAVIRKVAEEVMKETGVQFEYMVGTMIEIPRAALTADEIAKHAEFFSFGTNDLTQMTFGYSRDDVGGFLPYYLDENILENDPFQTLDQTGVGQLLECGTRLGRKSRPDLKVGICGEHGGDAESIKFCHRVGMDYVSCSPFRVPIARLSAAHAVLEEKAAKKK
ncbi:MAG: pyruvate, phosphate dikinase [Desulfobacteraceae bacterium 4572_87]|nr:MAG: pyruvate, phosphate dikinase [Desulfobacteraceae bacterium 4572_87]